MQEAGQRELGLFALFGIKTGGFCIRRTAVGPINREGGPILGPRTDRKGLAKPVKDRPYRKITFKSDG